MGCLAQGMFLLLMYSIATLEFLINVQHVYLIFTDLSFLHALIRNYMFINFDDLFLPTLLFGTNSKPEHKDQSLKNE